MVRLKSTRNMPMQSISSGGNDGLQLLGYEVMDGDLNMEYLSLVHDCGYSVKEVTAKAGGLNGFGLFDSYENAKQFADFAKTQAEFDAHHENPIIWQIWGSRCRSADRPKFSVHEGMIEEDRPMSERLR